MKNFGETEFLFKYLYLLQRPKLLRRWEGSEWWRKGLVYLYIPKNLRITTVHSFPFINVHLPLRSASVYTNLILNLGWCCRSFFIAFFTLFHLYLIHSVVKTHTHIHTYILPTDMCKCSLFWMQIRDAFFPLWYCFLE